MCLALKLINLLFTKASSEMASMTHYPVRSGKHLIGRILIFQQDNVTKHTAIQQKHTWIEKLTGEHCQSWID